MTVETGPDVDVRHLRLDGAITAECVTVLVSRKSAGSLKNYLENRQLLLEKCGETSGEVKIAKSLIGQIDESLEEGDNINGALDLTLNIGEISQFGALLRDQGIRLPPLMRAMAEITGKMDKGDGGDLVDTYKYCTGVLNQIESMPH